MSQALEKISAVARNVDSNTMGLQYLDMMKELASGDSSKWVVPVELTQIAQKFLGNAGPDQNK